MALTGNLEVFPLEEVLRLLARARKSGCLRIQSPAGAGRIYLDDGGLTFASVLSDDVVRARLLSAGILDRGAAAGPNGPTLAELASGQGKGDLATDLIREFTIESLYRLRKPGRGAFDFAVGLGPVYPTGLTFDVEVCIADSDHRAVEWADIESSLPSMDMPVRMVAELPEGREVTINPNTWRLIAAFAGSATPHDLAERLGTTGFRVARELVGLVRSGLVETVPDETHTPVVEAQAQGGFDSGDTRTIYPGAPGGVAASPAGAWAPAATEETPAVPEVPQTHTDEATDVYTDEPAVAYGATPAEAQISEMDSESPAAEDVAVDRKWYETPSEAGTAAVAPVPDSAEGLADEAGDGSDADRFLESVFSQLTDEPEAEITDEPEDGTDDDSGFNLGLLRRRRMGAASREIIDGEA